MKNIQLKGALKQISALNNSSKNDEIEILDNKKAALVKGGTQSTTKPPADSCGKVFSCGLYHLL